MESKPFIVACIPAYNEERTIGGIILKTMRYVDRVVVCDDGSNDLTGDIAERLGAVLVRHERNRGKGAALRTAFNCAKNFEPDVVVMLDADGQHDPGNIPRLVDPILNGEGDIVIGSRYVEGSKMDGPLYRKLGLKFINSLSGRSGVLNVADAQSGFRAFSLSALDVVLDTEVTGYGADTEQLTLAFKKGLRIVEVPVNIQYGGLRKTSKKHPLFHGGELISTILRLIVEERPLFFLGVPGIFFIILGVFFGGWFLWYFNMTRFFSVPMALISVGALLLGSLFFITSLMLYAISRLKNKKN